MQRNQAIDIAKGFAIICMVLGHCHTFPYKSFIYSFHMPLFFLFAGYFYKQREMKDSIRKDFYRLIVPYIVFELILCLKFTITKSITGDIDTILNIWTKAIWTGGPKSDNGTIFGWITVMGPLWFLPALFWCKNIYNILHTICKKKWGLMASCISLSIISILLFNHVINLPFGVLTGCSAIILYMIGNYAKLFSIPNYIKIGLIICWIASINFSYLDMVECRYDCYPLNILGACGGTIVIYYISQKISKYQLIIAQFMSWLGGASLIVMCMHFLNSILDLSSKLHTDKWYYLLFVEFVIIIPTTYFCTKINITKKIFQIK